MRRIVLSLAAALIVPCTVQAQGQLLLVPQPRDASHERDVVLARGVAIAIPADTDDAFAARDLVDALREGGLPLATGTGSARIVLLRSSSPAGRALLAKTRQTFDPAMQDEGYRPASTVSIKRL